MKFRAKNYLIIFTLDIIFPVVNRVRNEQSIKLILTCREIVKF